MFKVKELQLSPDIFENPLFRMHLHCFQWYGYVASTEQSHPWFSLIRCIVFTASIWISCALMLTRVFLSGSYENLSVGATSWATAVQYFAVSIATLNAYMQRERVVFMLRQAHADLQAFKLQADDQELELLDSTQRYLRTITMMLWVPSVVAGLMAWSDCIYRTIFLPQTVFNAAAVHRGEAQPILLFKLFPFADLCDNFFIGYLGPWYALGLGITTIPLWHTFITCLMKYITLKLQILNKRVIAMDITRMKPDLVVQHLTPAELNLWRLRLCKQFVEEQLRIRQFVHELQQLIRVPVFADFIIFSVLMCFLFFALTVGVPSKMDYSFMFIYLFVMAAILWIYHWHATLIVECKDDLAFACYACDWYNFDVPVQKRLLFMMQHTQRPMKMRALLVDMNLKTFLDIVRGAYSYFNLLRGTHSY
ncbi:odorant receptor 56a [Drosophila nasuta]|uniref:Odorant receptor n=1 Tax=Drosophila albomicans TaxID=7291 RepID=A0A6P8WY44_DROAB|nr:odorant receptor 56a [Drosophila albomicans]XP_060659767.1 odorant receptor 56a [Drosophila nasuta]